MKKALIAAVMVLGATVAYAQSTTFDANQCPHTALGQLQEQAHTMLTDAGHADFDVTTLTLDQLVRLMCVDPSTPVGKEQIDQILGK